MEETNETLCIGIDLGTSRSSISASNGERHVVDSYVGWPVDMVARKLVKKRVLVGRDALEQRAMLELLRHLMGLAGLAPESGARPMVQAVVGVPAETFRANRERLRAAMAGLAD